MINKFLEMVKESNNIVFFGGAGVSTESGIPDFRSVDGLYQMKYEYPPEMILSHTFFKNNTYEFFKFYKDKMLCLDAKPNVIHTTLAKLEQAGKLSAVVTQNIDGLHQLAGSKNVYELHGSIHRNYCTKCGRFYSAEYIRDCDGIPTCDCGGIIKPDVVLYEEMLDENIINKSINAIANADMLIIGGTSLSVYPAASFVRYFKGKYLVIINKSSTQMDCNADLVMHSSLGEVFSKIKID